MPMPVVAAAIVTSGIGSATRNGAAPLEAWTARQRRRTVSGAPSSRSIRVPGVGQADDAGADHHQVRRSIRHEL